jgi:hypothetical protein
MPRSPSDDRRLPRDLGRPDGRFHIERITDVNGEHFAVYEGEELQFYAPTLFKAEIEMKLWQKRIETDEQLAARAAEIEGLRAEVERLHAAQEERLGRVEAFQHERDPHVTGGQRDDRDGGQPPSWHARAKTLMLEILGKDTNLSHIEAARRIIRRWGSDPPCPVKLTTMRTFVSLNRP